MTQQEVVLAARGLTKAYGANQVLHGIDLDIRAGSALGVVGENGAGKSTLLGILSGRTSPSGGTLSAQGQEQHFASPRAARNAGIVLIPQELAYVPHLTVAENLLLANWPARRWTVSHRRVLREGQAALDRLGLKVDARRTLAELSLAERQLVEIAKALLGQARVLILDEPTAALHARETAFLMEQLHQLKDDGVALIYVSHHLDELFEITDELAVLRNGRLADLTRTADTTVDRTVTLMLGTERPPEGAPRNPADTSPGLSLRAWSCSTQPRLDDVDLEVRGGEVLGLFGLVGSGAETIARGLGGHQRGIRGTVTDGTLTTGVPGKPREARAHGIAYVPAERKTDGLALGRTITESLSVMVLGRFARFGMWLDRRKNNRFCTEAVSTFDVRCRSVDQEVGELSGGNQQKVLVASRLLAGPRVLVLHEPTRGVDIGSRHQIHQQLHDYSRRGGAVLLVTTDVQEAISATDRLLVMRDGKVIGELVGSRKTESTALALAIGGSDV
ncbi:sugar ABC transporter ATP-binding protein [Streptomyces sp. R39]|uniref:Sugar ABC transporter ATP-binding protein n=1 Tax=Streptomyces sp. R39 TaxID=3238631 RepID=A0AB39R1P3_9ACTN